MSATTDTERKDTVATVMVRWPKTWGPALTVEEAQEVFLDDHIHSLLVVEGTRLLAVVERDDLTTASPRDVASRHGRRTGRIVEPDTDLARAWSSMVAAGCRRLAVLDEAGCLLGLLCLKRSGRGFCTDAGIRARAAERDEPHRGGGSPHPWTGPDHEPADSSPRFEAMPGA